MIEFVNAKINIGLNIVGKRADGYHLLETLFYPVGKYSGSPVDPSPFCDIMELTARRADDNQGHNSGGYEYGNLLFLFSGDAIDCAPEKNLVVKGVKAIYDYVREYGGDGFPEMTLRLEKHLPAGAGMGGGSADCVAAMKLVRAKLQECGFEVPDDDEMCRIAARLGADCPVFVANRPAYAEGIGERLDYRDEFLHGKWLVVVKPNLFISTATAFAGVTVKRPEVSLERLITLPLEEWKDRIVNDFEASLFPKFPVLKELKEALYAQGAVYASLTGSGAALYGIFYSEEAARQACMAIDSPYKTVLLL